MPDPGFWKNVVRERDGIKDVPLSKIERERILTALDQYIAYLKSQRRSDENYDALAEKIRKLD